MTKKYVSPGETINYINTTGVAIVSGQVVRVGHQIGIATVDIPIGGQGAVALEGVFSGVPKVVGAVYVQGEKLLWDASAAAFDDSVATPAAGDIMGAVTAWVAGANGETTCTIKLTPGNATLT